MHKRDVWYLLLLRSGMINQQPQRRNQYKSGPGSVNLGHPFRIAIVGAGPAGLSAAARAAELDGASQRTAPSYVLLEGFSAIAKTIQRYQKGKKVMDEPGFLDLRSDLQFAAGPREQVLENWVQGVGQLRLNIRFGAEVVKVTGSKGDFSIRLADGTTVTAEHVVLAIGVEGNPRKIGAPGEELAGVTLVVERRVEGSPLGDVTYVTRIDGGRVRYLTGAAPDADLVLLSDYPTARALARGELNAQQAFAAGRLKLRGSLDTLVAHARTLGLDDVRATTSFDD